MNSKSNEQLRASIEVMLHQLIYDTSAKRAKRSVSVEDAIKSRATATQILTLLQQTALEAKIEEHKKMVKLLKDFKPQPGQTTAYSFGSAGAGMVYGEWQNFCENRISDLQEQLAKGEK